MARRASTGANGGLRFESLIRENGNSRAMRARLDAAGRIVIPAEFRQALGVKSGDEVLMRVLDGEVRVYTPEHAIRQLQEWGATLAPGRSLADELIAERRAEALGE